MVEPNEQSGPKPGFQHEVEKAMEDDPARVLDFVTEVGKIKAIGSAGDEDINRYYEGGLERFIADTNAKGLKVKVMPPKLGACMVDEVPDGQTVTEFVQQEVSNDFLISRVPASQSTIRPVYVYNEQSLHKLLAERKDVLDEFGWPHDPASFVIATELVIAPHHTKMFDVVADAFGDTDNLYRTDKYDEFLEEKRKLEEAGSWEVYLAQRERQERQEIREASPEEYRREYEYQGAMMQHDIEFDALVDSIPEDRPELREVVRGMWYYKPDKLLHPEKLAKLRAENEPLFKEVSTHYMRHLQRQLGLNPESSQ